MKLFASLLLLLTSATFCVAQEPADPVVPSQSKEAKIVLEAPSAARVGELVRFDVSASVADSFKWLVVPQTVDFEVYAEGRKAVFSARMPGEYEFIVACAKNGTVDVVRHVIIIRSPPSHPATDSLEEWIPFWAYSLTLPSSDAEKLAAVYEEVAAANHQKPEDWIEATAAATRASNINLELWKPLLKKIGEALLKKAQEGKLTTPEQHKAQWLEIAAGLRKI